jgi:hypothetical protein
VTRDARFPTQRVFSRFAVDNEKETEVELRGSEIESDELCAPATASASTGLKAGDLVRVRSREEIEATLNDWKELKGCTFMPEMWEYCGTIRRVLKPMARFLDERDYRVNKCKGIVLLEGGICNGTLSLGRCDRCCYLFWREEWLEKIG